MKEQEKPPVEKKQSFWKNRKLMTILASIFMVITVLAVLFIFDHRHTGEKTATENDLNNISISSVDNSTQTDVQTATDQTQTKTAVDYYNDGQNSMAAQKWQDAITSFDRAINLDNKNPNYYNRKSQAQYNLDQKNQAIDTLQAGIANNPDSDLLKSRLDVLQKEWVGSQPQ